MEICDSEVCHQLEACNSTKTCEKRHPKNCKQYDTEKGCQFGSECDYNHKPIKDVGKPCGCQAKIDILENIVTEMANKIINQKNELKNMKTVPTEDSELNEKVKLMEAVIQKMFVNVIQLEAKINNKKFQ